MVVQITPYDVIVYSRSVLGVEDDSNHIDDALLVALLRRCAGINCPCSRAALSVAVSDSLAYLYSDADKLTERLEVLIDELIIAGDLLELSEVSTNEPETKGTWVFAAPPSFVVRRSGSIFLNGIVRDQDGFLPADLAARIVYARTTRYIVPKRGEDIPETLLSLGLHQLHENVWLKSPKTQAAEQVIERFNQLLASEPECGPTNDVKVLDSSKNVTYYRGRWVEIKNQTGTFVARRPQEFGAPLWCVVELAEGTTRRVLDLPPQHYRWRGCDAAWYLQLAMDHCLGHPQRYQRRRTDNGLVFDFYSPIPLWAQRRLMILGQECHTEGSLFAYEIPSAEGEEEERFLQENLWLAPASE